MSDKTIENYIEAQYRDLLVNDLLNPEFSELYLQFTNEKIKKIFSALHKRFEVSFKAMNQRLPTGDSGGHFLAQDSRDLIWAVDMALSLHRALKNSQFKFDINQYYFELLIKCQSFLKKSGGSPIPPNMETIDIPYLIPIFISGLNLKIERSMESFQSSMQIIGEGSYAKVFKCKDEFFDRHFAIKRALDNLEQKEFERFRREFEEMKKLSSPYVLEVYKYEDGKNQYYMELMDFTLDKYISTNNGKLSRDQRVSLVRQVLRGFGYLHSEGLLHRDISPKNVLVRVYDDVIVAKISDFGLVKTPNSSLTSVNTDMKGYFNDPVLRTEGWANFEMTHEMYALTMLIYFIMTGRTDVSKISDQKTKMFVFGGLTQDRTQRYKDIGEITMAFNEMIR